MGKEKTTTTTDTSQSQRVTATPEETAYNQMQLKNAQELNPQSQALQGAGINLGTLLLQGMQLPGYLKNLPGGISPEVTQGLVDQSMRDVKSFANQGGILDSGVSASIAGRTAGDIRMNSEQFNLQNLQQLLNLAVGGQAQPLQISSTAGGQLGQRLAGLRQTDLSGNNTATTKSMNPFLKSFQTSFGQSLGTGSGKFLVGG